MQFRFDLPPRPLAHSHKAVPRVAAMIIFHAACSLSSLLEAKSLIDNNFPDGKSIDPREFGDFLKAAMQHWAKPIKPIAGP